MSYINVQNVYFYTEKNNGLKNDRFGVKNIRAAIKKSQTMQLKSRNKI